MLVTIICPRRVQVILRIWFHSKKKILYLGNIQRASDLKSSKSCKKNTRKRQMKQNLSFKITTQKWQPNRAQGLPHFNRQLKSWNAKLTSGSGALNLLMICKRSKSMLYPTINFPWKDRQIYFIIVNTTFFPTGTNHVMCLFIALFKKNIPI